MSFRAFMTALLWLLLHVAALGCASALIDRSSAAFVVCVGIVAWYLMTVVFSFHLVPIGARLVAFFLSSEEGSFVTESDYNELHQTYDARDRENQFFANCRRGLPLIGDVVYLQWPLYTVRAATSAILTITIEASKSIWTGEQTLCRLVETETVTDRDPNKTVVDKREEHREGAWQTDPIAPRPVRHVRTETHNNLTRTIEMVSKIEQRKIPKVELVVDVEVIFRLGVKLGAFINAFPKVKSFDDPAALQEAISGQFQSIVDEAIRGAASHFTWNGNDHINDDLNRQTFERMVIAKLREPKSAFVKAGLLEALDPQMAAQLINQGQPLMTNGEAATDLDIAFEDIRPASPELIKAISKLAEASYQADAAEYEALATQRRERGLTDALKERAEKLNTEGELPLVTDAIKSSGGSLVLVAPDVAGAAALFQTGGQSLKRKGPAGGQQPPTDPTNP